MVFLALAFHRFLVPLFQNLQNTFPTFHLKEPKYRQSDPYEKHGDKESSSEEKINTNTQVSHPRYLAAELVFVVKDV